MSVRERRPTSRLRRPPTPASARRRFACMSAAVAAIATIVACESPPAPGENAQQESTTMPEPTPIEHIVPEGVARLPVFTPAVRVGDLVFLSGAIGTPARRRA